MATDANYNFWQQLVKLLAAMITIATVAIMVTLATMVTVATTVTMVTMNTKTYSEVRAGKGFS